MLPSMDATNTKKVIVTAYEELPRRRPSGHGAASTSTAARAKTRASSASTHAAGGYSRRALLLAYAQQLRRRGGQPIRGPRMLEWGKWKAAPAAGTGRDAVAGRRRSWCSRFRFCVRLWFGTFLRRVKRVRENASCKNQIRSEILM